MARQGILFEYEPVSHKISTWGYHFDSLTELKFAISIMDDYEFLRTPFPIYYDVATKQPVKFVRRCDRRYTPDFLIRHRETGHAILIEIKPRGIEGHPQLLLRKEVAENYIRLHRYDWKFKVLYDDEIILNEEQLEDYKEYCSLRSRHAIATWFNQYYEKNKRKSPSPLRLTGNKRINFIMFGSKCDPVRTKFELIARRFKNIV